VAAPAQGGGAAASGAKPNKIAAAVAKAAHAAGLPDPAAPAEDADVGEGDSSSDDDAGGVTGADTSADGVSADGVTRGAAAAAGDGSNGGDAALQQLLAGLQEQMQRLIAQEERRSLDLVRLKAKVCMHGACGLWCVAAVPAG
jgi:hypothetical protein